MDDYYNQLEAAVKLLEMGCTRVRVGNIEAERPVSALLPTTTPRQTPLADLQSMLSLDDESDRGALWDAVGGPPSDVDL